MHELWTNLSTIGDDLLTLLGTVLGLLLHWSALIAWVAWWLFAVNWKRMWPALRSGSWAAIVLIAVMVAFAWSRMFPSDASLVEGYAIENFWWQLGVVAFFVGVAFFCGWVQGAMGWQPAEVNLEAPPAHAHGQDHHGHGAHAEAHVAPAHGHGN